MVSGHRVNKSSSSAPEAFLLTNGLNQLFYIFLAINASRKTTNLFDCLLKDFISWSGEGKQESISYVSETAQSYQDLSTIWIQQYQTRGKQPFKREDLKRSKFQSAHGHYQRQCVEKNPTFHQTVTVWWKNTLKSSKSRCLELTNSIIRLQGEETKKKSIRKLISFHRYERAKRSNLSLHIPHLPLNVYF